ncbi:unnamed protein product [Withania somnifera]
MVISSLCSSKKSPAKALHLLLLLFSFQVENGDKKKVQICIRRKGQKYSSVEANSLAMLRAKEFQANLPSQFPSFIKCMLSSHVTRGFWLSFPRKFCNSHLPKRDDTAVLVDENDKRIFYQVYIVRKNCLTEIALTLLEIHARPIKSFLEDIRFSESRVEFQDVKDFSGFNIVVDGLIIDSEVGDHIRIKYYDLCRTQNSYLHDHLLDGLNVKLAAGVIMETVIIADGIKASNSSTPSNDLENWDRLLKAFECFGMGVGFLRERLSKLANMSCELKNILASKEVELAEAEEEMLNLEEKFLKGKQVIKNLDSEIKALTTKDAIFEVNFKALATAPC